MNPIYKRIHSLIYEQEMNATILVIGQPGKGKSTEAIKVACDLDSTFNVDRICFSIEEMLKIINEGDSTGKLTRGKALLLDEAAGSEEAADSRNAMSKVNKIISFFTTISRQKGLIIFYVTPLLSQLDKRLRLVGVTAVIVAQGVNRRKKLSRAEWYWIYASALSDRVMMPKPRILQNETKEPRLVPYVWFPYPRNKELMKAYRAKKDAFISGSTARWYADIVDKRQKKKDRRIDLRELAELAKKEKDKLFQAGRYSAGLLQSRFDIGKESAYHLRQLLEKEASG